jgi:hypothetical protein
MKNQEIARILQNMIEEAEENLIRLAEAMTGYENLEHLDKRRAELKEAMALEAELLEALAILDAAPDIFARHAPATLETIKASAILGEALDARPKPPSGAESGETICYIGPGALSKEQIDIHIIRRYLDNAPRKSITDKNERLLAIASLDRLALLASHSVEPPSGAESAKTVLMDRLLKAFGDLTPSERSSWIDIDATIRSIFNENKEGTDDGL